MGIEEVKDDLPFDTDDGDDPVPFNKKEKELLDMRDEDFVPHSWAELQQIISANELGRLTRSPSQTQRYLRWRNKIAEHYGNITGFLVKDRLQWTPKPNADPTAGPTFEYRNENFFVDPSDFKILLNDWPYGMDPGIWHIVIWTKTPIPVDPEIGDLTDQSRAVINEYVNRVFRQRINEEKPGDKVLWFKNWIALQSVRGIDHVHILVRDVEDDVIKEWIGKT